MRKRIPMLINDASETSETVKTIYNNSLDVPRYANLFYWLVYDESGKSIFDDHIYVAYNTRYKVGDMFTPRDNSYNINLETGKWEDLVGVFENSLEYGSLFVVEEEPYYDQVYLIGHLRSHRFVTIRSLRTGNLYRCLCEELEFMKDINDCD